MGLVVSGCGACYASSHTGLHPEYNDCHPMSGMDKSLERFMKMEEEFVSSVKCLGNHLNDLEKLDMRLGAQENYIRSIRLKLQGLIHGSAGISNGYAGMPNIQNNLNSQTVINNQTTMNTNNTCINSNFFQSMQPGNTPFDGSLIPEQEKNDLENQITALTQQKNQLEAENKALKANSTGGPSAGYISIDDIKNLVDAEIKGAGTNNAKINALKNLMNKIQKQIEAITKPNIEN